MVRYDYDYRSMGQLKRSPVVQAACLELAKQMAEEAKRLAPIGPARRGSQPPGEYAASIRAIPHPTERGEVGARVVAGPLWAEFGRRHTRPYQGAHALSRAARVMSAPRRSA